jgi:hypothetical protein
MEAGPGPNAPGMIDDTDVEVDEARPLSGSG